MFVLLLLALPVVEVFALIEVGHAIGWLLALLLLFGTSVLGTRLLRIQSRSAMARISLAVSENRPPAGPAIDGGLGLVGGLLLVVPGFVTDALGALLVFPATRSLARRWLSRHYSGRAMSFVVSAGRFAPQERGRQPADIESTAVEDYPNQLER